MRYAQHIHALVCHSKTSHLGVALHNEVDDAEVLQSGVCLACHELCGWDVQEFVLCIEDRMQATMMIQIFIIKVILNIPTLAWVNKP